MSLTEILVLCLIGILAGFVGSLVGLGGGIIIIPMITFVFGFDIKIITTVTICSTFFTGISSSFSNIRNHLVNFKISSILMIVTLTGSIVGLFMSNMFKSNLLYLFLAIVMFIQVIFIGIKLYKNISSSSNEIKKNSMARNGVAGSIMFFAGFFTGLLGIGSGSFRILAMDTVMRLPLKTATAMSNFIMAIDTGLLIVILLWAGKINFVITIPVIIGAAIGGFVGSKLMYVLPNIHLRILLMIFMLVSAVQMLLKSF